MNRVCFPRLSFKPPGTKVTMAEIKTSRSASKSYHVGGESPARERKSRGRCSEKESVCSADEFLLSGGEPPARDDNEQKKEPCKLLSVLQCQKKMAFSTWRRALST